MSWGDYWGSAGGLNVTGESGIELSYDASLYSPADHGITYLAATGDGYQPFGGSITNVPSYPAFSPNVVAVGGTTLTAPGGVYGSEVGWNQSDGFSCGGISQVENQPGYQQGLVINSGSSVVDQNGMRAVPDVSLNAATSVAVYDSFDFGSSTPWILGGGTSLACPIWAGLVGIGDQSADHGLGRSTGHARPCRPCTASTVTRRSTPAISTTSRPAPTTNIPPAPATT